MSRYLDTISAKLRKKVKGECYCAEEIKLHRMSVFRFGAPDKCIFCFSKTQEAKEYDVDSANARIIQLRKDSIRRY